MKPIAFLRSAFKRKGKKKLSKTPLCVEPLLLVPPASPLLTPGFTEVTPVLSPGFEYIHEDPIIDRPATTEVKNWALLSPSTGLDLQGEHRFHPVAPSHGCSQNASNLEGPKPQHSLQPPLYLRSRPPSPNLRSPTLVQLSPEPQTKKVHLSSLRQTLRRIGVQKACVSSDIVEVIYEGSRDLQEIHTRISDSSSSSGHISASNVVADSTSTAYAILDSSTSSIMKTFVCASRLSPYHQMKASLETESQLHGDNLNLPQDALASFPRPPPLKVKRKPQPLTLLPTLTTNRLSPSQVSSANSTPSVTPLSSPRSPKFSNRPIRTIIPPRCSPPHTPLPTPPTSSAFLAPSDHGDLPGVGKVLRAIHSTSELCDYWFPVCPVDNPESSSPPAGVFISDNASRWCDQLNPALKSDCSSRETTDVPHQYPLYEHGLSETQIQWGYAL